MVKNSLERVEFFIRFGKQQEETPKSKSFQEILQEHLISNYSYVPIISTVLINVTGLVFEIVRYIYLKTKGKFSNF